MKLNHTFTFRSFRPERYKEIAGPIAANIKRACEIVQSQAKQNVSGSDHPRIVTGQLKEGIKINIYRKGETVKGYIGITRDEFYGRMLEFGTVKMPPYPWLFPAFESKYKQIQKMLRGR